MSNSIPRGRRIANSIPRRHNYIPDSESDLGSEEFFIDYSELDPIQQDIINRKHEQNLVVSGTAGSGKSLIALHKAKQLSQESYAVIVYTKALRRYFATGLKTLGLTNIFHWEDWQRMSDKPHVKYLIVDECQDFFKDEIDEMMQYGDYCLFFGDTSQSIMGFRRPKEDLLHGTQSVEETAKSLNCSIDWLCFNYRLTKEVADVVLKVGEPNIMIPTLFKGNVTDYKTEDRKYTLTNVPYVAIESGNGILIGDYYIGRKKSNIYNPVVFVRHGESPKFINEYNGSDNRSNFNAQLDRIIEIIRNTQLTNVAILLPFNFKESAENYRKGTKISEPIDYLSVEYVKEYIRAIIPCEFQYSSTPYEDMNLNFRSTNPKIMTYWVAKGLQFKDVFIPGCENEVLNKRDKYQAVAVAMSRCSERLYVCYSGKLCKIFDDSFKPEYKTTLDDLDF